MHFLIFSITIMPVTYHHCFSLPSRFTFDLLEWFLSILNMQISILWGSVSSIPKIIAAHFKAKWLWSSAKNKVTRSQPISYFIIYGFNWWDKLNPLFKYFPVYSMILLIGFQFSQAGLYIDKFEELLWPCISFFSGVASLFFWETLTLSLNDQV